MRKVRTRTFQAFVARHSHFETGPAPIPISFDRAKRWVSYNIRPCHGGLWIGARPNGGTGRSRSNFGSRPALSAVPLLLAFSGHSAIFSNRETGRHSRTQKLELSLLATMPSKLRVRNRTRGLLSQELTGAFRGAFEIESDNIATFLFTFFDYSIPFTRSISSSDIVRHDRARGDSGTLYDLGAKPRWRDISKNFRAAIGNIAAMHPTL